MNKTGNPIDWNDKNVLRTLPDGWYNVPADSVYAEEMRKNPWLKEGDTRELAEKRHQDEQNEKTKCKKHKKYDCFHEHISKSNGYKICMLCGLMRKDITQSVPEEGYEYTGCIKKK